MKVKTNFYDKYFRRVGDLISKKEYDAAGRVLITIAETTMDGKNLSFMLQLENFD